MKAKFKKILPYILIVLAVILLGIVISVVLQFNFKGENIDLREPSKTEGEKQYNLVNESTMNEDEINNIIESKRDDIIGFFNPIRYYNISDIDPSFNKDDDEKYMVLTNDFTDNLKLLVTGNLFNKLTSHFETLKVEDNTTYYKVYKEEFTPLHSNSAIAIFDFLDKEIHPTYASNKKIESIVRLKTCSDPIYKICSRDDEYKFVLVKENNDWLIDDIGIGIDKNSDTI